MALGLRTVSGETTELADEQLAELGMTFRGRLLAPQDDGYEQARVVQNGGVDRRPGLIVQCSGTADVIDAVNLARQQQLLTAVRSGGHSIAGYGVCDDGLMLDLSAMRGVWVDPSVRVGGSRWHCLHHRRRRADAGWGDRLAAPRLWAGLRQPALGGDRDGRRAAAASQRDREPRPVLGAARGRRQLRCRHDV